MIGADDLLDRFELVRRQRLDDWMVSCPAHADRTPSLHVTRIPDRWLFKCHAGCATSEILSASGLRWADMFEDRQPDRVIDATYPYTDGNGKLLFEVVRFWPKAFAQRRPDPVQEWVWSLRGVRRVLYRLPAVLRRARHGGAVWVVEGEKDVHALERAGEVATCCPGGAGAWRHEYSQSLRGAEVRVVIDRDEAGVEHARQVMQSLHTAMVPALCFEPAVGNDVSDHLRARCSVEELVPVQLRLRNAVPQQQQLEELITSFPSFELFEVWLRTEMARRRKSINGSAQGSLM